MYRNNEQKLNRFYRHTVTLICLFFVFLSLSSQLTWAANSEELSSFTASDKWKFGVTDSELEIPQPVIETDGSDNSYVTGFGKGCVIELGSYDFTKGEPGRIRIEYSLDPVDDENLPKVYVAFGTGSNRMVFGPWKLKATGDWETSTIKLKLPSGKKWPSKKTKVFLINEGSETEVQTDISVSGLKILGAAPEAGSGDGKDKDKGDSNNKPSTSSPGTTSTHHSPSYSYHSYSSPSSSTSGSSGPMRKVKLIGFSIEGRSGSDEYDEEFYDEEGEFEEMEEYDEHPIHIPGMPFAILLLILLGVDLKLEIHRRSFSGIKVKQKREKKKFKLKKIKLKDLKFKLPKIKRQKEELDDDYDYYYDLDDI